MTENELNNLKFDFYALLHEYDNERKSTLERCSPPCSFGEEVARVRDKTVNLMVSRVREGETQTQDNHDIKISINKCSQCKHAGHSGAFTPGGAISICNHEGAPRNDVQGVRDFRDINSREIAIRVFGQRKITHTIIPEWCPLKQGGMY
jgi:hypothetical protein